MSNSVEKRFTDIYVNKSWVDTRFNNHESLSGDGSTLEYTKNLRDKLPELFKQFNIKSVLDAPCGDLNWMQKVLEQCPDIVYTGGDIVKFLVDNHNTKFKDNPNVKFVNLDITVDSLPAADLMICRDCLFHLSNEHIKMFFRNFAQSNIKYLLTTSHLVRDNVGDITSGGYRSINLLKAPFDFQPNYMYEIDDWIAPHPERKMYLWTREQIAEVVPTFD